MRGVLVAGDRARQAAGTRAGLAEELRRRVDGVLPALAAAAPGWPVRHNHCFRRIVYDTLAGQNWRHCWPAPAIAHMTEAELAAAVALCDRLAAEGPALCRDWNSASLRGRGRHSVATARAAWS